MTLKSKLPERLKERRIFTAGELHAAILERLSRPTCYSIIGGQLPSMKTLEVLCDTFGWHPGVCLELQQNSK